MTIERQNVHRDPATHTQTIVVPVNGLWLALPKQQFLEAIARGAEISEVHQSRPVESEAEVLLTAEGMASVTGVPASWFSEQARRGKVPSIPFGKYVRFRLKEVLEHLKSTRHADKLSAVPKKRLCGQ